MDWLHTLLKPQLVWFLVGLFLALAELAIPGLVVVFFGLGAWIVALLAALFDIGVNTQLTLFIVSSVLSLVLLRKWLKGIFLGHTSDAQELTEDLRDVLGEHVTVQVAIHPGRPGTVEFHGTPWAAEADEPLEAGARAEIVGKENLTLRVKPLTA